MKLWRTVLFLAVIGGRGFGQSRLVDVYLNSRDASYQLLRPGTPLASEIFNKIGVRLSWHAGELPANKVGIGIRTVEHAPESASPDALASSRLTGSTGVEITVYKDRVQYFLSLHGNLARVAVPYVLAHELAHAMEGVPRHSEMGIMKAHWSDLDFQAMVYHKLSFAPADVELIHQGLVAHLGSGAPTQTANQ